MNVVPTDMDPVVAARNLCDRHTIKQPFEVGSLLTGAARELGYDGGLYAGPPRGDAVLVWCASSYWAWNWTVQYGRAAMDQYMQRFNRPHSAFQAIVWAERLNIPRYSFKNSRPEGRFILRMPKDLINNEDPIDSYRKYIGFKERETARMARIYRLAAHAVNHMSTSRIHLGKPSQGPHQPMRWRPPSERPRWLPLTPPSPDPSEAMIAAAKNWFANSGLPYKRTTEMLDDADAVDMLISLVG